MPNVPGWLVHPSDDRPGEKVDHPAVVRRVTPLGTILLHGTRTSRDREGRRLAPEDVPAEPDGRVLWVEPTSDDGRALSLTARTFFCRTGTGFYRNPRDLRVIARCPNGLFLELRRIAVYTMAAGLDIRARRGNFREAGAAFAECRAVLRAAVPGVRGDGAPPEWSGVYVLTTK